MLCCGQPGSRKSVVMSPRIHAMRQIESLTCDSSKGEQLAIQNITEEGLKQVLTTSSSIIWHADEFKQWWGALNNRGGSSSLS
jgi:hypothetical protein